MPAGRKPLRRHFGALTSDIRGAEAMPFVKWAGGKGQLIPQMRSFIPSTYRTYFEPFLGGGALFFHLKPERAILSDLNHDLILAFQIVRDNPEGLMRALEKHNLKKNSSEYYYRIRAQDPNQLGPVDRAARLVFLNKTCYNGLFRVNSKGEFNVPFGRYKNPTLYDSENIWAAHKALQGQVIITRDFRETSDHAREGDFVYLDPPYQPLSETSKFTAYTNASFNEAAQKELSRVFRLLDERGCKVLLSNSSTDLVRSLYVGYRIEKVKAARAINCKGGGRGAIEEILVANYGS